MVLLQNNNTLDKVLTCSLKVYSFLLPVIWTKLLYVELYLENSTFLLLYKLHIDYSKIYPSFICAVLSLEKLYENVYWNVRGVLTFVIYCIYLLTLIIPNLYDFLFSVKHKLRHFEKKIKGQWVPIVTKTVPTFKIPFVVSRKIKSYRFEITQFHHNLLKLFIFG